MDTGTLTLLGTGMKLGSTIGGGFATMQQGKTAQKVANYEAEGMRRQGTEEFAAAQRAAMERRRETELLTSRQIALGASSGSAVNSPGLLDIIGDTEQRGRYREDAERYVGEQRRAGLNDRANVRVAEGQAARSRGSNAFVGSLLEGFGDFAKGMNTYRRNYG